MSRDWHQYEYVSEFALMEWIDEVAHEIEMASDACPKDQSGMAVQLVLATRRELLSRLVGQVTEHTRTLREIITDVRGEDPVRE